MWIVRQQQLCRREHDLRSLHGLPVGQRVIFQTDVWHPFRGNVAPVAVTLISRKSLQQVKILPDEFFPVKFCWS